MYIFSDYRWQGQIECFNKSTIIKFALQIRVCKKSTLALVVSDIWEENEKCSSSRKKSVFSNVNEICL